MNDRTHNPKRDIASEIAQQLFQENESEFGELQLVFQTNNQPNLYILQSLTMEGAPSVHGRKLA